MILPLQTVPDGVIARLLADQGVLFASAMGSAITFIVVLIVVYLLGRVLVLPLLTRMLDARDLDRHAKAPIQKITRIVIGFVALAVAFGFAGYGSFLTSLATVAAAATLAIGFALQDVIKNFVAKDTLRFKFTFEIHYGDDVQQATEIIVDEASSHADILDEPAPSVRLTELDDSSVGLQARVWISDPSRTDYTRVRGEYVTAVKNRFDAEDITIPYPQRTLSGDLTIPDQESPSEA